MGVKLKSPILNAEHRLKVRENRVLWKIFKPQRDEMLGGLRKVHNEELLTCILHQI
jgi:hypothetical protein